MSMLTLAGATFSTGRANFLDAVPPAAGKTPRIYVRFAVGDTEEPYLALLDTGAEWSVLNCEIAKAMGLPTGTPLRLKHKDGVSEGSLVRATLVLLADEGSDLVVDATVFVPDSNPPRGGSFIGYAGFLDRIKLAVDPQNNDVYFGDYAS